MTSASAATSIHSIDNEIISQSNENSGAEINWVTQPGRSRTSGHDSLRKHPVLIPIHKTSNIPSRRNVYPRMF